MNLKVYRRLTALSISLVLLIVSATPIRAQEDLVTAITRYLVLHANPVYVIAVPPQGKIPASPPNLSVGTLRQPVSAPSPGEAITGLPFTMSAAQAVKIGSGLMEDKDFHMALVYFQEAQKLQPAMPEVLIGLAGCYYELQRDDEALATYRPLTEQQANVWEVQFNLGRIHLEGGRFEEAVAKFTNALKLKPSDPDTMRNLGLALTKIGRHAEAIPYLSQVAALKRFIPEDFYYLGEAYANSSDWVQAADAFKSGVDIRGIDPDGYSRWGKMLYNADKLDQALEAFKKVKALDIQHLESSYYMADIFRLLNNPAEALGYYRMVLKQKPDDKHVLVQAAYLCFKLKFMGEAEEHYTRIKSLDPTNAAITNLAAIQCRDNEKNVDLKKPTPGVTLREVVGANPNHGESHANLGAQLITEGFDAEAVTVLTRAISLLPNSAGAHFNLGLAQLKVGNYQGAVESNLRALKLKPEWSAAYNDLGLAYAGLNKWPEATQAYLEATRITPEYAGATYNLGRAHLALGRKDLAKPLLETLRKLSGFDLYARLSNAVAGVETSVAGTSASSTTAPSTVGSVPVEPTKVETSPPPVSEPQASPAQSSTTQVPTPPAVEVKAGEPVASETKAQPDKPAPVVVCPGPIYRPSDVTKMATITSEFPSFTTDEASKSNVEGRVVLQAFLCSNGQVSDITVEKSLPFGLTERAIELMKLIQFQPAQLDAKPVSVMLRQEFICAPTGCSAVRL